MPNAIRTLIDRYHITIYHNAIALDSVLPRYDGDTTEQASMTSLVNFSTNNNDVDPVQSSPPQVPGAAAEASPSPTKVVKLKFPSLKRRLSKFNKRSSTDKNKAAVESTSLASPSDSQLAETASSAETSMTTVDDQSLQSPDTFVTDEQKINDQNELNEKYEEGNYQQKRNGNCSCRPLCMGVACNSNGASNNSANNCIQLLL